MKLSTEFLRLAITQSVAEISSHDDIAAVAAKDLYGSETVTPMHFEIACARRLGWWRPFTWLGIPYLVTGLVASMAYGEPRLTNDIDVVAGIREEHIPGLLAAFPPMPISAQKRFRRRSRDKANSISFIRGAD